MFYVIVPLRFSAAHFATVVVVVDNNALLTLLAESWKHHGNREQLSLGYPVGNINLRRSSSIHSFIHSIINHESWLLRHDSRALSWDGKKPFRRKTPVYIRKKLLSIWILESLTMSATRSAEEIVHRRTRY